MSGSGCILWINAVETTGTAASEWQLWDGTNTQGPLLADVTLTAGQSTRDQVHHHNLPFRQSLYFVPLSGSTRGSVSVLTGHWCPGQVVRGVQGTPPGFSGPQIGPQVPPNEMWP